MEKITFCLLFLLFGLAPSGVPRPPVNLTVETVSATWVTLRWQVVGARNVTTFVVTLWPQNSTRRFPRLSMRRLRWSGLAYSGKIDQLLPETAYAVTVSAFGDRGVSGPSQPCIFETDAESMKRRSLRERIRVGEVLVVVALLAAWLLAIALFLRKWGKIRILQPGMTRQQHPPKNLENVKVVKRPNDSVIYRNYSKTISDTMTARETKHISRMHTVPNIKLNTFAQMNALNEEDAASNDESASISALVRSVANAPARKPRSLDDVNTATTSPTYDQQNAAADK